MKVRAIAPDLDITVGKIYDVLGEDTIYYWIECDNYGGHARPKYLFEVVEEENKCMKIMKKISRRLMKITEGILMFLELFLGLLGMTLLLCPQETLDQMQVILTDSTMTDSLKVFPLLWLVLSLIQILPVLCQCCRKIFLRICKH